ncbi:glycosyltransferase family 2 protein [Fulvivirgaceae bacterium LMO-SS25]
MKEPLKKVSSISIISPVYGAQGMINELVNRISKAVENICEDYEIILVEDHSPDNSWLEMEVVSKQNIRVKSIKLSKNFGQHYAITAGLDIAKGDWIVVMDCDLQDKPEEIPNLLAKALNGFDIVLARRVERQDNFFIRLTSLIFYKILSYLTGTTQDHTIANFGIYSKKVIDTIRAMREPIRYFPTMVKWVGFEKAFQDVSHGEREQGSSGYNFNKRLKLAVDIMLAFSNKPLLLTVKLGLFISISSFLVSIMVFVFALLGKYTVSGYASMMMSIWFLSGLIIFILGINGLYLSKVFDGVKNRPIYLIDKRVN